MYQYPYGNAQQLNLDWILNKIQELESGEGEVDLEEVANALVSASYDTGNSYRKYDYAFYNNKLYRCINDTTGAWNPSDWTEVPIGDDVSILTRLINTAVITDVKFDTDGTNGKLQQKYGASYHDVVEVDYTPVQNSKRPLSSNAGYDLNNTINDISTTTNTLFTLEGLQIGKSAAGVTAATRAISADIYCENGIVVKAEQLPLNLKYEIEYYSSSNISDFVGAVPTGWITDNNTYSSPSSITQKHFRILFGSVDNNALTASDFDGLVLQVNNGNDLEITAKDKDARLTADEAKNTADCAEDALENWGDALTSLTWHYNATTVPAHGTVSVMPNNSADKLSRWYFVGIVSMVTGNANLLLRGAVGYNGELTIVNIGDTAETFEGSFQVRFFDPLVLQNFFA